MAPRRLQRSSDDRMLFGVAGGLAEYFDIDPVLVRVGFVIAGLLNGIGVIAYLILAIVTPRGARSHSAGQTGPEDVATIPEEPAEAGGRRRTGAPRDKRDQSLLVIGALVVIVGCFWLFATLGALLWVTRIFALWFLPALAVGIGVVLILAATRRK